jgi:hypothetical protein
VADFNSSKSFLIVYPSDIAKSDLDLLVEFVVEIKSEKKDVFFLIYHDLKKIPMGTIIKSFDTHICQKDFNIFKSPSSSTLQSQIQISYDYLISFFDKPNKRMENFIKKSKAKFKIGMWEPDNKSLYNIKLSKVEGVNMIKSFLTMTGNYITKIKTEI